MNVIDLPKPWSDTPLSVVVPTYDEAENLPRLTERLFALGVPNLRVIVVDDNSPDGTGDIADDLARSANVEAPDRMIVLHRPQKEGIGRAYLAGLGEALRRGDPYVVQMDADLSHQPEAIPTMLGSALANRAGLVIGSRYVASGTLSQRWGLYRRLLSRGGSLYVNAVLNLRIRDTTGGFKLWSRDTLELIGLETVRSGGFSFQIEMNYLARQSGARVVEVPIHFDERFSGQSKISLAIQLEGLWVPLTLLGRR